MEDAPPGGCEDTTRCRDARDSDGGVVHGCVHQPTLNSQRVCSQERGSIAHSGCPGGAWCAPHVDVASRTLGLARGWKLGLARGSCCAATRTIHSSPCHRSCLQVGREGGGVLRPRHGVALSVRSRPLRCLLQGLRWSWGEAGGCSLLLCGGGGGSLGRVQMMQWPSSGAGRGAVGIHRPH